MPLQQLESDRTGGPPGPGKRGSISAFSDTIFLIPRTAYGTTATRLAALVFVNWKSTAALAPRVVAVIV